MGRGPRGWWLMGRGLAREVSERGSRGVGRCEGHRSEGRLGKGGTLGLGGWLDWGCWHCCCCCCECC